MMSPSDARQRQPTKLTDAEKHGLSGARYGLISLFVAWPPAPADTAVQRQDPNESPVSEDQSYSRSRPGYDNSASHAAQSQSDARVRFAVDQDPVELGVWQGRRVFVTSTTGRDRYFTLDDLYGFLPSLIEKAREEAWNTAGAAVPLFYVLHIGEVLHGRNRPRSESYRAIRFAPMRTSLSTDSAFTTPRLGPNSLRRLVEVVKDAYKFTEVGTVSHATNGQVALGDDVAASFFDHYSPLARRRGYVVLDPSISVVVDCSARDVRILLSIVQQAQLASRGITPQSFSSLLLRVAIWDGNQDELAVLQGLEDLIVDNAIATRGQVMLAVALFGAGTLLGLLQSRVLHERSTELEIPVALCAVSAGLYVLYLVAKKPVMHILGLLLLVAAAVLASALILVSDLHLPTLPHAF